jgi:hypothetical protein
MVSVVEPAGRVQLSVPPDTLVYTQMNFFPNVYPIALLDTHMPVVSQEFPKYVSIASVQLLTVAT